MLFSCFGFSIINIILHLGLTHKTLIGFHHGTKVIAGP